MFGCCRSKFTVKLVAETFTQRLAVNPCDKESWMGGREVGGSRDWLLCENQALLCMLITRLDEGSVAFIFYAMEQLTARLRQSQRLR